VTVLNRVTVVGGVYHQSGDLPPTCTPSSFGAMLQTDEAPFSCPRATAAEEWSAVPVGWLDECSLVGIKNLGPDPSGKVPTEEEKSALAAKVLEVCSGKDFVEGGAWLVHPGHDMRACPGDLRSLRVRCRSGKTRYSVTVFPK
jgi:hypothetical protein